MEHSSMSEFFRTQFGSVFEKQFIMSAAELNFNTFIHECDFVFRINLRLWMLCELWDSVSIT